MVVLLVLNHMDRDLDDTEWVVNRLKADILAESALGQFIVQITKRGVTLNSEIIECIHYSDFSRMN